MNSNSWCRALGIETPRLEKVKDHSKANTYALLLVALLERGEPMTLAEVASRFAEAGVADEARALLSLQRCKPGRAPVVRDGDHYHLDPHHHELDLWAFILGLRPPRVQPPKADLPESPPIPGPEVPLSKAELDEAWTGASLSSGWSAQRLVLAVIDAKGGGPMLPKEVVAELDERTEWHRIDEDPEKFKRRNSAIEVLGDGRWAIAADAAETLQATREHVRQRVEMSRRHARPRFNPAELRAQREEYALQRSENAARLAKMKRVLLVGFPAREPEAVALLDLGAHEIQTFVGAELEALPQLLAPFEIIGAVEVRALLRALGFDPGERRLAELGPSQKTTKIGDRGRTLKITNTLLVQGSCGISRPFGDEKKLASYLADGQHGKLRQRLEADVKSLHALYQYGRLHGGVRLRWRFIDEFIPAPWVHRDEPVLYKLKVAAREMDAPIEAVVGSAPGWSDPWERAQILRIAVDVNQDLWLVDREGRPIDDDDVQLARLAVTRH